MTTDDPMITAVAPDGTPLADTGRPPTKGQGGDHGRAAVDVNGRRRCCVCKALLTKDDGKSVYCRIHKEVAIKAATKARNDKRRQAEIGRKRIRSEGHWEGPGFTHGRAGLYLEAATVAAITRSYAAALATHVEAAPLGRSPFDPEKAHEYHQALRAILHAIKDLNAVLRSPFLPEADRRSHREGDES